MAVTDGGGVWTNCTTTITASTFSGNLSGRDGGGMYAYSGKTGIQNSTFTGNMATGDGGGIKGTNNTLSVSNITVSGNAGTTGGGISYTGTGLALQNTFLANSLSGADCYSSSAPTKDLDNLIVDNSGCGTPVSTADPMLGPLQENGGPTRTLMLASGSPAIDAGDDIECSAILIGGAQTLPSDTDQRGLSRAQGAHCDIGSVERQSIEDYIFNNGFDPD